MREIAIEPASTAPKLSAKLRGVSSVTLKTRRQGAGLRGMDPAVLIALVGSGGAGLGALITGLLAIARESKAKRVTIHGRLGRQIEFPADTTPERLEELIEAAKQLDVDRLKID